MSTDVLYFDAFIHNVRLKWVILTYLLFTLQLVFVKRLVILSHNHQQQPTNQRTAWIQCFGCLKHRMRVNMTVAWLSTTALLWLTLAISNGDELSRTTHSDGSAVSIIRGQLLIGFSTKTYVLLLQIIIIRIIMMMMMMENVLMAPNCYPGLEATL